MFDVSHTESMRRCESKQEENAVNQKGILIVVSGFAGTGKGTLMKRLLQDYDNYALSVSMTTRSPRPGERDGIEYFFVTKEAFEEKIAQDGLVEYACYVGNYYGTPRAYVEEKLGEGKDVILEIEIQGALKIKEKFPDSVLIFVMPPSLRTFPRPPKNTMFPPPTSPRASSGWKRSFLSPCLTDVPIG